MRRPQSDQSTDQKPSPSKKSKRGARAIGVVEFLPGGGTRLVPVALWMDGKYYDASLYGANPEPVALEPGTVYEAQEYGETTGTFVVNTPKLINGSWAGDGHWTPRRSMDAKLAGDAAKQPKPINKESKAIFTGDTDQGPPVLRRAGDQSASTQNAQPGEKSGSSPPPQSGSASKPSQDTASNSSGKTSSSTTQSASSDSGHPTLKRPSDESSAPTDAGTTAQAAGSSSTVSDDSNRPVLHRSTAPQTNTTMSEDDPDRPVFRKPGGSGDNVPQSGTPQADDPERPVLARGGASAISQPSSAKNQTPKVGATILRGSAGATAHAFAAISDAGTYELRSLLYPMTPEQRQQQAPPVLAIALADIRAYAAKRPGPLIPKGAAISDYDLRIFDLDFSNSPTIVLSAKLPVAAPSSKPFAYYATVVARLDINGAPQKVFSSVTDTTHLDVYQRMELVDAVDADANGRGDLLFRQYSDTGTSYALYRVFPYQMEKVFEGGSSL